MPGLLARLFGSAAPHDPSADPAELARIGAAVRDRLEADFGARNRAGRRGALYIFRDFIGEQQCSQLIQLIDSRITPSPLFNDGDGAGIRTSSTHYFADDQPVAIAVARRIDALLGLDHSHAETLQGQRYLPGEEYRHHCDFFRTDREHWHRERLRGGQRTWTAMLYLNAVEMGGATHFPRLDLSIQPEPDMLVVWNNMSEKGSANYATVHAGQPVLAGRKYVVTQWYRQCSWKRRGACQTG